MFSRFSEDDLVFQVDGNEYSIENFAETDDGNEEFEGINEVNVAELFEEEKASIGILYTNKAFCSFDIEIDLPGYKKEDVQAELKDGYMTINASRNSNDDKKDEEGNYIRRERYYGSCSRSFYVGKQITEEDIKAKFEDGILKISVPKKEVKKEIPEKKYIAIEG